MFGHQGHRVFVGKRQSLLHRFPRDRAIHGARVEVRVAEPRRQLARDRTLAGAGRSIDRDDQALGHQP